VSDDGLFEWAVVWGKRVAALALLTGMAAAVVGAGVFAVGTLFDGGSPGGGVTAGDGGDDDPRPTTTPPTTDGDTEGSAGTGNETATPTRVVVGVETGSDLRGPDRYRGTVVQAVDFWRENADRAGYGVQPVVNLSAADPDVLVRVTDNVTCEGDPGAVGCAPLLSDTRAFAANETVDVRLEPRPNDRLTYRIAVHELGHVFGVEHCTEPRTFMYMDCPPEARSGQRPDATERDSPWRPTPWSEADETATTEVRVYVDAAGWVPGERGEAVTQVQRALEYYERTATADGVGPVQFTEVEDPYRADVRINFSRETQLCALPDVCSYRRGVSTDADDALERYSYAHVELALENPDLVGWRTGRRLGRLLGAADQSELPPAFRNPDEVDPAGSWWTYDGED